MLRWIRRKATQCHHCREQVKIGDPTFSKQTNGKTRYYHYECARSVNLTQGDFVEVSREKR